MGEKFFNPKNCIVPTVKLIIHGPQSVSIP